MKIAVDLDDTLSVVDRVTLASGYIARKNLPYKLVDPDSHAIKDVFDWDIDAVYEFIREGGITVFTDAEARKGARETLTALREAGHEIIVLTARQKSWFINPEKVSRDWLEKRKIPYDEIVAGETDKGKYCVEHGISVLIDDNADTCVRAQELGVRAVLMIGANNADRAHEVRYGGSNWRQLAAVLQAIVQRN